MVINYQNPSFIKRRLIRYLAGPPSTQLYVLWEALLWAKCDEAERGGGSWDLK